MASGVRRLAISEITKKGLKKGKALAEQIAEASNVNKKSKQGK